MRQALTSRILSTIEYAYSYCLLRLPLFPRTLQTVFPVSLHIFCQGPEHGRCPQVARYSSVPLLVLWLGSTFISFASVVRYLQRAGTMHTKNVRDEKMIENVICLRIVTLYRSYSKVFAWFTSIHAKACRIKEARWDIYGLARLLTVRYGQVHACVISPSSWHLHRHRPQS